MIHLVLNSKLKIHDVKEDLKVLGVRKWRQEVHDIEQWWKVVEALGPTKKISHEIKYLKISLSNAKFENVFKVGSTKITANHSVD